MFWNKAKIIFVIIFCLTVYVATETYQLSPRLPPIPGISQPPLEGESSTISTTTTSNSPTIPTSPTLTTNEMKQVSILDYTGGLELDIDKTNTLQKLCIGHDYEAIPYTGNPYQYIICIPNDPFSRNCPAGQCFDQLSPPCNANACTAPDLSYNLIKEYCTQSDDTFLQRVPDKNCEYFYICLGKDVEPKHQKCPQNQHFSRMSKNCTNPIEAACMEQSKWCINKPNGVKFSATKCYQYYECFNQKTEFQSCLYYEYFNIEQNKCVRGTCEDNEIKTPICLNNGSYMPHSKCNKYYECLNKSPVERQCVAGYYFNTERNDCVRDVNNECKILI